MRLSAKQIRFLSHAHLIAAAAPLRPTSYLLSLGKENDPTDRTSFGGIRICYLLTGSILKHLYERTQIVRSHKPRSGSPNQPWHLVHWHLVLRRKGKPFRLLLCLIVGLLVRSILKRLYAREKSWLLAAGMGYYLIRDL